MDNVFIVKETIVRQRLNRPSDKAFEYFRVFSSLELAQDYLHNEYVDSLERGYYRHFDEEAGYLVLNKKDKPVRTIYEIEAYPLYTEADL